MQFGVFFPNERRRDLKVNFMKKKKTFRAHKILFELSFNAGFQRNQREKK